jgi:DnaJ-class molecular chaperone
MTHYATLGVGESATPEEIKQAYRKLASRHHPDRGGDTATFQTIQAAYDIISDADRRAQYDHERANPGGMRFSFNGQPFSGVPPGMENIFEQFGFNFGGAPWHVHQPRRNKDLRIEITVDLASTLADQHKTVSVQTTNGHRETVEVTIPRGVTHGTQIKYSGLGDNFFNSLPRGDLYVAFAVTVPIEFELHDLDVVTAVEIDCLDAITGADVEVTGIDGSKFLLTVPAGAQHNNLFRIPNNGVWQLNGSHRGNLLVKIMITVPRQLSPAQLDLIRQIKISQ